MKKIVINNALPMLFALITGAFFVGLFFFSTSSNQTMYQTEPVSKGPIEVTVNGVGEVNAAQLVTVGAQVSGKIEAVHIKLGDKVKQNDLIATIDASMQRSELATRKSRLRTYKAQLVNHTIAADIALAQYERKKKLHAQDSTSMQDLENAQKASAQAQAELEATKSLITQEEVAIAKAETDLSYTRIVAPIDGTIVSLPVEVGQTVNANHTTPTIALLADLSRMEIKVQISEGDITKITKGIPVTFYILSEPETRFTTSVYSIDPATTALTDEYDQGRNSSSSNKAVYYYCRMLMANPDGVLRIGMTAHCTIEITSADNTLRVPSMAVKRHKDRTYINIFENGRPVRRDITTGLFNSMYTEVKSGLKEGEQVITAQMTQAEMNAQIKKRQR